MKPLPDRKQEFKAKLWQYVKENGGLDKFPRQNLKEFFDYWTEHNEPVTARTKMRFEMEKVFHVGRRLGTWFKNVKEPVRNHPFQHNPENIKYVPNGPCKTEEQLKEEARQIKEMEELYEAAKANSKPVKVKPIKDMGTFRDPKYLEFKKNYEQSKNT